MTKVFLVNEDYIKTNSNISDNLFGSFLVPAIRESQDINLQGVLGSKLYEAILSKVSDGSIGNKENEDYKALIDDYIQPFLLYQVLSNILPIIGTKLANLGVLTTDDEKAMNVSQAERARLQDYYQYKADFYCARLQDYLVENRKLFKELKSCKLIKPNLDSSATCPIWLGGIRGRKH